MATKAEVEFWKDMNRKLTGIIESQRYTYTAVMGKVYARGEELKSLQAIVDGLEWQVEDLQAENDKLRELVGMMSKAIGVSATACYGDCIAPYECSLDGGCPIQRLICELGVEVDNV